MGEFSFRVFGLRGRRPPPQHLITKREVARWPPFSSGAHDHRSLFNMCVHKHINTAEATVWLFSSDSSPRPRLQQAAEPLFRLAPPYKALCVLWGRVWLVPQILALAAERPPLRDRVRGCYDQLMDCAFQWQRFTQTASPLMLPLLLVRSHKKGLGFSSKRQTCASG